MTTFFGGTDVGLVRETNQDRFDYAVLSGSVSFAVLCDGMGGHSGGNVASETATRFVVEALRRDLVDGLEETSLRAILDSAIAGANAAVYEAAQKNPELTGMGTTMVVAVVCGDKLYVSYVGDSRVYIASPEGEVQLTKDHTVVQMLVDIGEITQEDAHTHPKRNYITRAVGVSPGVEADFLVHQLQPGELILLCSDGFYHYLETGSLYPLLADCAGKGSIGQLIDIAKAGGGHDNITAIIGARNLPHGGKETHG